MTSPARHQLGFVKMWHARSVDVRLLWGASPLPQVEMGLSSAVEDDDASPLPLDDLARRLALALQVPPALWLSESGALEWPAPLFPFQKDGIAALIEAPRLLLGDEMGLGKSVQTIAALRILLHRREIERALLVVPAALIEQWRRQWQLWAPEIAVICVGGAARERRFLWRTRAHVSLVSYETLRADAGLKRGPGQQPWGAVVLDEAQKIKNADSEIARVCKALPRARSWLLSGTPLENSADDVASLLEFLTGRRPGGPLLGSLLKSVLLRRKIAEVLPQLPPKIVTELPLELSPAQRRAYERAERDGLVSLREGAVSMENILAILMKLKQICNFDPLTGASAKLDDLRGRLHEIAASGQKALVFTQFTGDFGVRRLAAALGELSPLIYTGEMTPAQRSATLDRFAADPTRSTLILSLQAGGQGLNLQGASYVFHFDRWWNPASEAQAEGRAHRLGQERPVHVYRYVSPGTVEERIAAVLERKTALFEAIIEGRAPEIGRLLTRAELLEVVGMGGLGVGG